LGARPPWGSALPADCASTLDDSGGLLEAPSIPSARNFLQPPHVGGSWARLVGANYGWFSVPPPNLVRNDRADEFESGLTAAWPVDGVWIRRGGGEWSTTGFG
jgi:hypothetical protein